MCVRGIGISLSPNNFNKTKQAIFDELIENRKTYTITEEELKELKTLSVPSPRDEEIAVERVKALTELAALRNTTVRELMKELDVKPHKNINKI